MIVGQWLHSSRIQVIQESPAVLSTAVHGRENNFVLAPGIPVTNICHKHAESRQHAANEPLLVLVQWSPPAIWMGQTSESSSVNRVRQMRRSMNPMFKKVSFLTSLGEAYGYDDAYNKIWKLYNREAYILILTTT
jgi:FPC/CPF motif-containing protein YcgG